MQRCIVLIYSFSKGQIYFLIFFIVILALNPPVHGQFEIEVDLFLVFVEDAYVDLVAAFYAIFEDEVDEAESVVCDQVVVGQFVVHFQDQVIVVKWLDLAFVIVNHEFFWRQLRIYPTVVVWHIEINFYEASRVYWLTIGYF